MRIQTQNLKYSPTEEHSFSVKELPFYRVQHGEIIFDNEQFMKLYPKLKQGDPEIDTLFLSYQLFAALSEEKHNLF